MLAATLDPTMDVVAIPSGRTERDGCTLLTFAGSLATYERNAEIATQGARVTHCIAVVSGCIRTVRHLEDGRRQIAEFLFPGDLLGWDGIGTAQFGAEAVTAVTVRRVAHRAIEERAERDLVFALHLRRYAAAQAGAARARYVVLGRKSARERIASFLREMQARFGARFELPMARIDIADYLGLTPETVCRIMSDLRQLGLIHAERTRIDVLDPAGLAQMSSDELP